MGSYRKDTHFSNMRVLLSYITTSAALHNVPAVLAPLAISVMGFKVIMAEDGELNRICAAVSATLSLL